MAENDLTAVQGASEQYEHAEGKTQQDAPRSGELPTRIHGVIFDMDDTLIDSEHAWHAASQHLWREAGGELGNRDFLGGTVEDVARAYAEDFPTTSEGEPVNIDAVGRHLEQLIRSHLRTELAPMPGAEALLTRLAGSIPLAIGSNSPSAIVRDSVEALGWKHLFTAALGTNDVERPKPHPDLYLTAARALEADPRQCVIFEDSPVGAQAALDTGAFVVTIGPAAVGKGHAAVDTLADSLIRAWQPESSR